MKLAAVRAIADLAMAEQSDIVAAAYGEQNLRFGPEYLIPKPFDPRLIVQIAPAVAKAAMDSGVATRPIEDFDAYRDSLQQFVYHSGFMMKPIFAAAKKSPQRIVYAEGEDERVLRAVQVVVDEGLAQADPDRPAGGDRAADRALRPAHQARRRLRADQPRVATRITASTGRSTTASPSARASRSQYAKIEMRRRATLIGAMVIHSGEADGMLCGTFGTHDLHLHYIDQVIGLRPGVQPLRRDERADAARSARSSSATPTSTSIRPPSRSPRSRCSRPRRSAASASRRKVALLSHSNFGTQRPAAARRRCSAALELISRRCARSSRSKARCTATPRCPRRCAGSAFPRSRLKGEANLLIMPTLDAANISFNLLKTAAGDGVTLGPILLGVHAPGAHPDAVGDGAADRQHDGADGRRRERPADAFLRLGGGATLLPARLREHRGERRREEHANQHENRADPDRRRRARGLPGRGAQGGRASSSASRARARSRSCAALRPARSTPRRSRSTPTTSPRRCGISSASGKASAATTSTAATGRGSSAPAGGGSANLMLINRAEPDLAARQHAAARNARRARWTSRASRRTSMSARSTRCRSPPPATPPARA